MPDELAAYRKIMEDVGFGVVDASSFFRSLIKKNYFKLGESGRLNVLDREVALFNGLKDTIPQHISFPQSSISEFHYRTHNTFEFWARWSFQNGMPRVGEKLEELIRVRTDLADLMKHQLVEESFPERAMLLRPHIFNTYLEIGRISGVKRNNRYHSPLPEHRYNDEHQLTDAATVTYVHDICVLSGDSDMFRMNNVFNFGREDYARRYGFPEQLFNVDVIFNQKGRFKLITHDGEFIKLETKYSV